MKSALQDQNALVARTVLAFLMIAIAAAVRAVPHPWNFTPVGAMALFSGAMIRDRRWAFAFPLLALFVGDIFVGFHVLMPFVYASFAVNIAIGLLLHDRRSFGRISMATLAGAVQFFLVTNFAVWAYFNTFPKTLMGLAACYFAGLPLFWNTLAGDAIYVALLFGGYALAERYLPALRDSSLATTHGD
jgi:hypothetical protein